jgi:hypothetical protein
MYNELALHTPFGSCPDDLSWGPFIQGSVGICTALVSFQMQIDCGGAREALKRLHDSPSFRTGAGAVLAMLPPLGMFILFILLHQQFTKGFALGQEK